MKKIISVSLAAVLILSSCGSAEVENQVAKKEAKVIKVETIKKEVFGEELKLVGKVSSVMETSIVPLTSGVIKSVNAEVGKKVNAGDLLATIDLSNSAYKTSFDNASNAYSNSMTSYDATLSAINDDLQSAKIQLENAKMARDNTYSTTEKQLALTQTQLDNIRKTKDNTFNTTSESLKNAELLVKNAKTSLDNFEKTSASNLDSLYSNAKVLIGSSVSTSETSLNYADTILSVTEKNRNTNSAYSIYLGAKDISTKQPAEDAFRNANSLFAEAIKITAMNKQETENKLFAVVALLDSEANLYEKMVSLINNTVPGGSFSQTQLDTLSSNIAKNQGTILSLQSQVTAIKNTLSTTKTQIETQRESIQNAYSLALTQYDTIKAGNTSQIDSVNGNETLTQNQLDSTNASIKASRDGVDNAVKIAEATYESVKSKLAAQKAQIQSSLDGARGGKDLAKIQLDNTKIIAPFAGVITARNIEAGSLASPGVPAFSIGTSDSIKIKMDISSDNVSNLKIGQEVRVVKNGNENKGIITLISPSSDLQTKMFKVEVSFVKKPSNLNLGDYVDAYIIKEAGAEKIIAVPFSSLVSLGQGDYSVFMVNGDQVKSAQVKIGSQNSTHVVIVSGLKEGDKIAITGATTLQDGDIIKEEK